MAKEKFTKEQLVEKSDAFVRHQTYLARYGTGLAKEMVLLFDDKELWKLIKEGGKKAEIDKKISTIINAQRKATATKLWKAMKELAKIELDWLSSLFTLTIKGKVPADKIIEEAANYPLVATNNNVASMLESSIDRFQDQTQNVSMMLNAELVTPMEGSAAFMASFAHLKTMIDMCVRTMAFSVASQAREMAYQANKDIIRGVIMTAVLDGRTTNYCKAIDGKIYKTGEGPRPPFHPRCRTIAMAVMVYDTDEEAMERLKYRTRVGPGEEYKPGDNTASSTRDNISKGVVDVKTSDKKQQSSGSYAAFLKSQVHTSAGKEFIRDTLGVTRGNWFIKKAKEGGNVEKILKNAVELELNSITDKELRSRKYK